MSIAIIWLSEYLNVFIEESPASIVRENSTFDFSYFLGGLPFPVKKVCRVNGLEPKLAVEVGNKGQMFADSYRSVGIR